MKLKCGWCHYEDKSVVASFMNESEQGNYYAYCEPHAVEARKKYENEKTYHIENVPEMCSVFAGEHPHLVMDEPGDSVPDVQVRPEDPPKPTCKWHGKKVKHGIPPPDLYEGWGESRPLGGGYHTFDYPQQIRDVEERMVQEHCDAVWSHVRSSMREMPTCHGKHLELMVNVEEGTAEWFCWEHGNEEG